MPIDTEVKYNRAIALLNDGDAVDDPKLRSDLEAGVRAFETQRFGGPGAKREGMGAVDQVEEANPRPAEPPSKRLPEGAPDEPGVMFRVRQGDIRTALKNRPIALSEVDVPKPEEAAPDTSAMNSEQLLELAAKHENAAAATSKLRSASKDPAFYRPPEYNAFDKPGGATFADSIPNIIGGNVHFWPEPSMSQFRNELGKQLDASGITPGSERERQAYARFSDMKWAEAYDAARATATPIIRHSQMDTSDLTGKLGKYGASAFSDLATAVEGMGNGRIPGLSDAVAAGVDAVAPDAGATDTLRQSREEHPIANMVGGLAGAVSPKSLSGSVAGNVSRGVAGSAPGLFRKVVSSALGGAAGAATQTLGDDAAQSAVDKIQGRSGPALASSNEAGRLLSSATAGLAFGAAGELLGSGAKKLVDAARSPKSATGLALRNAEAAGVETNPITGLTIPKGIEQNELAASEMGHPLDYATAKAAPGIFDQAVERDAAMKLRLDQENEAAHQALDQQKVSAEPFANRTMALLLRHRSADSGRDLPGSNTTQLQQILKQTLHAEAVPAHKADDALGKVYDYFDASKLLGEQNVEGMIHEAKLKQANLLRGPGGKFLPKSQAYKIVVRPINLSSREADKVIESIDGLANIDTKRRGGEVDKDLMALTQAAREVRDRFVLNGEQGGYSALKNRHGDELTVHQRDLDAAGVTNVKKPFEQQDFEPRRAIEDSVRGFGHDAGRIAKDKALLELARSGGPELERALREVAGTRAVSDLQKQTAVRGVMTTHGPSLWGSFTNAAKLRIDPAMRAAAATPNFADLPAPVAKALRMARGGDAKSGAQQLFGLRGGMFGARSSEALTPEDVQNLLTLIGTVDAKKEKRTSP